MERIDTGAFFTSAGGRRETGKSGKGGKNAGARAGGSAKPSFLGALSAIEETEHAGEPGTVSDRERAAAADQAQGLLDEVHQRGDTLKREMTLAALESYKAAVQAFLRCVVEHGVGLVETSSGAHVMNRKRFTLVSVVDAKLERLAAGMVATQRDQLAILERVAEINGMLVDLLQ